MTGRAGPPPLPGLLLAALALAAPEARAQPTAGLEAQTATRYLWRGVLRANDLVFQPSLFGSLGTRWSLSGGIWANWQLSRTVPDDLSDLPPGRRGLSEWNPWLEGALHHDRFDAALGVVRYVYPSADSGGLRTPADNTTEVYARLRLPRVPCLKPSLVAWLDLDRARGAFIEASAAGGVPLLPMVANWDFAAAAGASFGQERNAARPSEAFSSAHSGLTYLQASTGPSARLGAWSIALDVHAQWSLDSLTRAATRITGRTHDLFAWFTLSGGYAWGARP